MAVKSHLFCHLECLPLQRVKLAKHGKGKEGFLGPAPALVHCCPAWLNPVQPTTRLYTRAFSEASSNCWCDLYSAAALRQRVGATQADHSSSNCVATGLRFDWAR
jgi:hypothetical protein